MSAARERTPELEDEILARLSEGEPLRAILRSDPDRFPSKSVFYAWMEGDYDLKARFLKAREDGAYAIAEETLAIDDQVPERTLTENGDKVAMEHTGPGGGPVQTVTRIERRIVKAE